MTYNVFGGTLDLSLSIYVKVTDERDQVQPKITCSIMLLFGKGNVFRSKTICLLVSLVVVLS